MAATVWKGHLTFGLVSLPVRLYSAARGEAVSFNQINPATGSRVKQKLVDATTGEEVERSQLVKGYEYEKDHYVIIEDEDIKKVAPPTAKVMEILEFVKGDEVDPVYLETSYYLAPEEAGQKPYALLFETLKKVNRYAVAKIAMHNREHIVILRPGKKGIVLHTMFYANEVRKADEFNADLNLVNDRELKLAEMLVETLAADFDPTKYSDTYREHLMGLIEAKKQGQEVMATPEPQTAKVIDILDALKASLASAKKPAAAAETSARAEAAPAKKAPRKRATG